MFCNFALPPPPPPPPSPLQLPPPLILCSRLILVCLSTIFFTIMACPLLPIRTIFKVSSLLLFQGDLQSQGPDPFYELESHTLIGVANIFMDCLHYNIPLEYSPPIIDPRGEVGVLVFFTILSSAKIKNAHWQRCATWDKLFIQGVSLKQLF